MQIKTKHWSLTKTFSGQQSLTMAEVRGESRGGNHQYGNTCLDNCHTTIFWIYGLATGTTCWQSQWFAITVSECHNMHLFPPLSGL